MATTQDGGPAFPVPATSTKTGMSLRDLFAAMAMQGIVSIHILHNPESVADKAYEIADCMLRSRDKKFGT